METTKKVLEKEYRLFGVIPLWRVKFFEYNIVPDELLQRDDTDKEGNIIVPDETFNRVMSEIIPYMNPNMYDPNDFVVAQQRLQEFQRKLREGGL